MTQNNHAINYDFGWIHEAIAKREANYSNVICFETGDPFRFHQLMHRLAQNSSFRDAGIYCFNRWSGLCITNREKGVFEPVSVGTGGNYAPDMRNSLKETRETLLYMDEILRKGKTVFVIYDIDASREEERERDIMDAVRDWAYNSELVLAGSIVMFMCKNAEMVLDTAALERVALIRPPLALPEERQRMISDNARTLGLSGNLDINASSRLVQATAGLNLHQIKTVLLESYNAQDTFSEEKIKELKSDIIRNTDLLEIEEPDPEGFDSVGGYEVVKEFVKNTIIRILEEPARARKLGIRTPRGIILFGPPGTGKTLFARALAREIYLPFINFKTENLYSQFLGVSGHKFRDAINLVEQMSPAIVFIDEIDKLGRRRESAGDGASEETRRVFNQILEWLGQRERKSIIVGTTNRPGDLDKAFRVGRIDYWIPFLYPNEEARRHIHRIHLHGTDLNQEVIREISGMTDGFSGAELEELCNRARRIAFSGSGDRVTHEDLLRACHAFRIDRKARKSEREKYLLMAEEFTNDLEFLEELRREA